MAEAKTNYEKQSNDLNYKYQLLTKSGWWHVEFVK